MFRYIRIQSAGYKADEPGAADELQALQWSMFRRNTGPAIDNRLVQFLPWGARVYEFTCGNFGYRDYDAGDYMVRTVTDVISGPSRSFPTRLVRSSTFIDPSFPAFQRA